MEFEKLPSSKPTQTRFLRSQQDLKAKYEAKESGDAEAEGKATRFRFLTPKYGTIIILHFVVVEPDKCFICEHDILF